MQTRGRPIARFRPASQGPTRTLWRLAVVATYGGYAAFIVA